MGMVFHFDEEVPTGRANGAAVPCGVEVAIGRGTVLIRVGPSGAAHRGWAVSFEDPEQLDRFAEAIATVRDLHEAGRSSR